MNFNNIVFRYEPTPEDTDRVKHLVEITGFFRQDEINVAVELVSERIIRGVASGYFFVFAWENGKMIGYSCYGPIPCTIASYDLYWIIVSPDFQGRGLGKIILKETERLIKESGGTRIYVETSQCHQYRSTRAFYEHCGYRLVSVLEDFYAPGDSKATYCKVIK